MLTDNDGGSGGGVAPHPAFLPRLAWWISCGFGAGLSPFAPGTAGSVVGLVLGVALWRVSPLALLAGLMVSVYGGLWAIRRATGQGLRGVHGGAADDPQWIVIDEIAGQMLSLLALHRLSLMGVAAAFALFRLFDVTKLGPIGWADRQGGAAGIMADDILAGVAAAGVLVAGQALRLF